MDFETDGSLTIDELPLTETVSDADIIPVNQASETKKTRLLTAKNYFTKEVSTSISAETTARQQGDTSTLTSAKSYSDGINTAIQNIIKNHVGIPVWDDNDYTLKFTAQNGTTLLVDFPLESLAKGLDYDPKTKEMVLTKQNGSKIRVNVSDLIDVYLGSTGEHIQVNIEEGNIIRATLLAGSITEEKLSVALLEKINSKADQSSLESEIWDREAADQSLEGQMVKRTEMGEPQGVATLNEHGKILAAQIPDIAGGTGIGEAPADDRIYGRQNEGWVDIDLDELKLGISEYLDADLLLDGDFMPVSQSNQKPRKVTLQQLAEYAVSRYIHINPHGSTLPPGIVLSGFINDEWLPYFRLIKLQGQTIDISPESPYFMLGQVIYVGDANNSNPNLDGCYKVNALGQRDINGTKMVLPDGSGLFFRGAGVNSRHFAANNTPYDGKKNGEYEQDTVQIPYSRLTFRTAESTDILYRAEGAFTLTVEEATTMTMAKSSVLGNIAVLRFGNGIRTGDVTKPPSLSLGLYMAY
jgi:hypothetical protein